MVSLLMSTDFNLMKLLTESYHMALKTLTIMLNSCGLLL